MKNIIFFMTHHILTRDHANICFQSLSNSINPITIDEMIIYNTHESELDNKILLDMFYMHNLDRFINKVSIFDYDTSSPKTLAADVRNIINWCTLNLNRNDRVLFLKSEMLVSVNYLNELGNSFDKDKIVVVPPLLNAKRSVSNNELLERSKLEYMIFSSEDTFFMEDETRSVENDFRDRPHELPSSNKVKYLSCTCKRDWSCHYISVNLLTHIVLEHKDWGGTNFESLNQYWKGMYKSFVIHKYHPIKSINRENDRPGDYGQWLNS